MKMNVKRAKLVAAAVVAIAVLAVAYYYLTGGFGGTPAGPGKYDELARCLTDKGAVLYGLATCPHCIEQKELFGSSFQYVTYVECSQQQALCTAKGVQFVPAWEIDGAIEVGVKPLATLAQEAGCPVPA
jgi:hypothetical protein